MLREYRLTRDDETIHVLAADVWQALEAACDLVDWPDFDDVRADVRAGAAWVPAVEVM
jgi:hypothetical protein